MAGLIGTLLPKGTLMRLFAKWRSVSSGAETVILKTQEVFSIKKIGTSVV